MNPETPLPDRPTGPPGVATQPGSHLTPIRSRRLTVPILVMLVIYALWLAWLAYVAWINVRAGNQ